MNLSNLPTAFYRQIFVFLSILDLIRLEQTDLKMYKLCQSWIGDAQSKRIRPLQLRHTTLENLSNVLFGIYLPDLSLWSLAFQHVVKSKDSVNLEDMKLHVPRQVVHSLFTCDEFRNKRISQAPIQEETWKTALLQSTDKFFNFFDSLYMLGAKLSIDQFLHRGIETFDAWSDRRKLFFLEQVTRHPKSTSPNAQSIIHLSMCALSMVLPSRSAAALKFAQYVLWTVWGPLTPVDHKPVQHPDQLPPLQYHVLQSVLVNDAIHQAMADNLVPSHLTVNNMYGVKRKFATRWYPNRNYEHLIHVISDETKHLMIIDVFRTQHVVLGFALHQQLIFFSDHTIEVRYGIMNTVTGAYDSLFTAKYDPVVPRIQEPPELMCWKYIPIHNIQCKFTCYLEPPPQLRTFKNLMNAKIMERQQAAISKFMDDWFWPAFGIPKPAKSSCFVHPRYAVVNCCIWDVFYSV